MIQPLHRKPLRPIYYSQRRVILYTTLLETNLDDKIMRTSINALTTHSYFPLASLKAHEDRVSAHSAPLPMHKVCRKDSVKAPIPQAMISA